MKNIILIIPLIALVSMCVADPNLLAVQLEAKYNSINDMIVDTKITYVETNSGVEYTYFYRKPYDSKYEFTNPDSINGDQLIDTQTTMWDIDKSKMVAIKTDYSSKPAPKKPDFLTGMWTLFSRADVTVDETDDTYVVTCDAKPGFIIEGDYDKEVYIINKSDMMPIKIEWYVNKTLVMFNEYSNYKINQGIQDSEFQPDTSKLAILHNPEDLPYCMPIADLKRDYPWLLTDITIPSGLSLECAWERGAPWQYAGKEEIVFEYVTTNDFNSNMWLYEADVPMWYFEEKYKSQPDNYTQVDVNGNTAYLYIGPYRGDSSDLIWKTTAGTYIHLSGRRTYGSEELVLEVARSIR